MLTVRLLCRFDRILVDSDVGVVEQCQYVDVEIKVGDIIDELLCGLGILEDPESMCGFFMFQTVAYCQTVFKKLIFECYIELVVA